MHLAMHLAMHFLTVFILSWWMQMVRVDTALRYAFGYAYASDKCLLMSEVSRYACCIAFRLVKMGTMPHVFNIHLC